MTEVAGYRVVLDRGMIPMIEIRGWMEYADILAVGLVGREFIRAKSSDQWIIGAHEFIRGNNKCRNVPAAHEFIHG